MEDQRRSGLGFVPQKEIVYTKLLPYADRFDEESNQIFSEIKGNLGRAVQLRDIKVAANYWVGQLERYLRLYGHKFSKADHISLIKLLYELVVVPDLEFSLTQKFANQLTLLLKKLELLSPEELVLPWKPLYRLLSSVIDSPYEHVGLQFLPSNIEAAINKLVRRCRAYFSIEATEEMLNEWRPLLCPFDVTIFKAINCMELFLPTTLSPDKQGQGFKLWLKELTDLWVSFHNAPAWENCMVSLFARVAYDNIGYIDWTPYISMVFARLLRSFNLPVGSSSMQIGRSGTSYDLNASALWIISMLGGGSIAQDHIDKLFRSLQTFYHPSNTGRWNVKLSNLMMIFPKTLIKRLDKERFQKPSWQTEVPKSHKLTEDDITRFVSSIKPVVFMGMFSKLGSQEASTALRYLSSVRPELIVPPLLEKMYPAIETLTEPHRLISCMNCMVGVSRSMLTSKKWYPEGAIHVIPLLNLSLPGIDSNDFKKSLVTFQLISTFITLVPLVDCSEAIHCRNDLTEIEKELCSASAQFEDFVLQFLDRGFGLIENNAQDHQSHGGSSQEYLNPEQSMFEVGLTSTFTSVLQQCSAAIFKSALQRLYTFVTQTVYEAHVGGRFTANLCKAAVKVNPKETLKLFMPNFCNNIKHCLAVQGDLINEEELDVEFLWNMLMLSQVVRTSGKELVTYEDDLLEILDSTLQLRCVQGYEYANQLLRHLLRSLTMVYPLEYRSIAGNINRPVSEYLAIRDWAKPGNVHNLGLKWHVPSSEEMKFATKLLARYLQPELKFVGSITMETNPLREELLRRLCTILECLLGTGALLPNWQGESIALEDSQVPLKHFGCCSTTTTEEITLDGGNVREAVEKSLHHLLVFMLAYNEDDTKSLQKIIQIYESLLFYHGTLKNELDNRWKNFRLVKGALEDKMKGKKKHIRALLVDRVQIQHELRMLYSSAKCFTEIHKRCFMDLLALTTSRYSEVRRKAQVVLFQGFQEFPYSYKLLLPELIHNLKDPTVTEHKFKGTLYILQGNGKKSIIVKRNWEVLGQVWPAIVQAQHSEELSILRVIDDINTKVIKYICSPALEIKVNDGLLEAAANLLKTTSPKPSAALATEQELKLSIKTEEKRNNIALQLYQKLVNDLVSLVESGNLSWKFRQIGIDFLTLLLRHDTPLPEKAVDLFVRCAIDDSIYIRKQSLSAVLGILKQTKRSHKTKVIDAYKVAGLDGQSQPIPTPGDRLDNDWHKYHKDNLPLTAEAWENCTFVEKTHWGYYCWPREMKVYAPRSEQPKLDRERAELSQSEQSIYDAFNSTTYVEKLVYFLALEDQKGKDKFKQKHVAFFKGLFRNFGDTFLEVFKPHIEKLLSEMSHEKRESYHRCSLELVTGIIRGSKHWPYEKVVRLWDWMAAVLRSGLNNIVVETVDDWASCFTTLSESRDPRKLHWLLEMLMDNPLNREGGSFGDSSRLYVLQNALIQQEWRVSELLHRLLQYLKQHMAHPYKNVRDRIGSLLGIIFLFDYAVHPGCRTDSPQRPAFIASIVSQLEPLKDISPEEAASLHDEGINHMEESVTLDTSYKVEHVNHVESSEERKFLVRLCKTVMKWISNGMNRMLITAPAEIFSFLPIMCTLVSEAQDVELKMDCCLALASVAQALLQPDAIPHAMHNIREVTKLTSWHARSAVLSFLQVMVFGNFFLMHQLKYIEQIKDIVLQLLCDERLEVREVAAETLGGLFQCGFLKIDQDLLSKFEKLSRTKFNEFCAQSEDLKKLCRRHSGVLGLCACIQAFPYDVPQFMPQVLMQISTHINDVQPIQMTVKKTLSNFRRTHHDNWHDHKQMFTDDQLMILTDLLVSPNYYA